MTKYKLTSAEEIEIEKSISYYKSLDLDVGSPEEFPNSERDFLSGLQKLKNLHDKIYKKKESSKK